MFDYTGPNQTWANALKRAECADIRVKPLDAGSPDDQDWLATSSEGTPAGDPFIYKQDVVAGPDGISVQCSCKASGPCLHLAKVLHDTGHLYPGDIRLIPLKGDKVAVIDAADFELVASIKWSVTESHNTFYARATINGKTERMHRLIMRAVPGQVIDHVNHDGLDNRRANLRFCTHSENHRNRPRSYGSTSTYKGVSWHAQTKKWRATITTHRSEKLVSLGLFKTEIEAALAYDNAARELFGEFACTNFPVIDEPSPQPTPLHIRQLQGRYSLALLNGDDVAEDAARAELRTLGVMA